MRAWSVALDSLQPHGLLPIRLLCPWDSLDKNSGVGYRAFLQRIFLTQGWNSWLLQLLHCRLILYRLATREDLLTQRVTKQAIKIQCDYCYKGAVQGESGKTSQKCSSGLMPGATVVRGGPAYWQVIWVWTGQHWGHERKPSRSSKSSSNLIPWLLIWNTWAPSQAKHIRILEG